MKTNTSPVTPSTTLRTGTQRKKYATCNFASNLHPDDAKAIEEFIKYRKKRNNLSKRSGQKKI